MKCLNKWLELNQFNFSSGAVSAESSNNQTASRVSEKFTKLKSLDNKKVETKKLRGEIDMIKVEEELKHLSL